MLTLEGWKKERQEYLRKVDRFEIPEEEWRDFLDDISPSICEELPQCNTGSFYEIAYPTIFRYMQTSDGLEKLKRRIASEFNRMGFAIVIKNIDLQEKIFFLTYIIGEKAHVEP